jgi:signal transduction histidine kinase
MKMNKEYSMIDAEDQLISVLDFEPKIEQHEIVMLTQKESRNKFIPMEKKSKKREIEKQMAELIIVNKELDRSLVSVSHDLRSPLNAILGLVSFIEDESTEANTLKHVMMIRKCITRMDKLIKNNITSFRNDSTELEIKEVPLQKSAEEVVDIFRNMKRARGIQFEIDIMEYEPFYSDEFRFNCILENIISNAIKYQEKDNLCKYIKITGQSDHEKVQLSIADNGIGIAATYHNKIFDMFFRLPGRIEGFGIGLHVVKHTVEVLQGTIIVQSEEGIGTTFIIELKNFKS